MSARVLVSLSGIDDATVDDGATFAAELAVRQVPLSLLVRPRSPAGLRRSVPWIGQRRAAGAAVLLHGYDHTSAAAFGRRTESGRRAEFGRRAELGRRAEFAALPAHEAALRLTAAVATLERHGLVTDLFAPPRWRASAGTMVALRRHGFALCAGVGSVCDLRSGEVHRGRVLELGSSGVAEPWWRRAVLLGVAGRVRRGGLLRLAVDAADLGRAGTMALDVLDTALRNGAVPATYRDLCRNGPTQRHRAAA